ncbi:MAG: hypothetical protein AAFO81_00770 [Pseudomonadota bacterium]
MALSIVRLATCYTVATLLAQRGNIDVFDGVRNGCHAADPE